MIEIRCPYCNGIAVLADSKEVYSKSYDKIWICRPCHAWVGCHRGSRQPLGTLANEQLRSARKAAHAAFDPIWKSGTMTRAAAYSWLASRLEILLDQCHIGLFDLEQCGNTELLCWSQGND